MRGGHVTTKVPGPTPTASVAAQPPATAPVSSGGCPDARTCGLYSTGEKVWPTKSDGSIVIPYRINPTGATQTSLSAEQIVSAIRHATRAWEEARPGLRFEFQGTTTEAAGTYNNVVGFGAAAGSAHVALAPTNELSSFSMVFNSATAWGWQPCGPAEREPCEPYEGTALDLQSTATHEWGHVLNLNHPPSSNGMEDELTMTTGYFSTPEGWPTRHRVTLGLGDILGLRKLYPTSAPMPTIYRP